MVGRRKKQTRQGGWKGRKDYVEVCCDEVLISVFFTLYSSFLFIALTWALLLSLHNICPLGS